MTVALGLALMISNVHAEFDSVDKELNARKVSDSVLAKMLGHRTQANKSKSGVCKLDPLDTEHEESEDNNAIRMPDPKTKSCMQGNCCELGYNFYTWPAYYKENEIMGPAIEEAKARLGNKDLFVCSRHFEDKVYETAKDTNDFEEVSKCHLELMASRRGEKATRPSNLRRRLSQCLVNEWL